MTFGRDCKDSRYGGAQTVVNAVNIDLAFVESRINNPRSVTPIVICGNHLYP